MDVPSPTPRRVSAPSWLDRRLLLGIALVLIAVLIGAKVVSSARSTVRRAVAATDLAAGTVLRAGDLRYADVRLPDDSQYVADVSQAVGHTLAEPVAGGELLPVSALGGGSARTTVSVPFPAGAAPRLSRGERIVVWLSTSACPSVRLLDDVPVEDVADDASSFGVAGTGQDVVVSVSPQLADRVVQALAIPNATIRAGVLSGPAPASPPALPALDQCVPSGS